MGTIEEIREKAEELLDSARQKGRKIAVAESCTGGMVASSLVDIAGSSEVFERGFITYSNEAKVEMLGVPAGLIETKGAVSKEVAIEMAKGAFHNSESDIALAVTGIAGPDGGTDEKPVGLVHFAVATMEGGVVDCHHVFEGDRLAIRQAATLKALELMLQCNK